MYGRRPVQAKTNTLENINGNNQYRDRSTRYLKKQAGGTCKKEGRWMRRRRGSKGHVEERLTERKEGTEIWKQDSRGLEEEEEQKGNEQTKKARD